MEENKIVKLSDVCDLIPGFAFKSSEFGEHQTKAVKIGDIQPPYVNYASMAGVDVTKYTLSKLAKYEIHKGDFVLAMTGATIGKIGRYISNTGAYINQRVLKFKPHEDVNSDFIYYIVSSTSFQKYILNNVDSETAQPNISAGSVGKYEFELPSLEEQNRIADILVSLDNKIQLNRQINDNLEQQAQNIFNHYFIESQTELGPYSEGFLTDIAVYLNGLAMQKFRPEGSDSGLPVLKIKELGQRTCDNNSDRCSSVIKDEYIVNDGDVIFSWSGTLLVDLWCGGKCGLNQHLFKVTSDSYPTWFYYFWTKHHLDNFIRVAKDKAVTMGHIKRTELEKANVIIPSQEKLSEIDKILSPIIDGIITHRVEMRRLAQLRDSLLPELMSGELNINEIDC